jgi:serine/threonine-protein kinase HipA
MNIDLEVWIDCDMAPLQQVGFISHDRGQVRFKYIREWLVQEKVAFALDPHLSLDEGSFFPAQHSENFGIFLDSSPDRWGQTLMRRREALQAKDEARQSRALYAWDFLLGVQDVTRQGGLRFKLPGSSTFLANEPLAAPPVTSLGELSIIALELSKKNINNLDQLRLWLSVLVAPGASLGGARPKANFLEADKSLWMAKFPASDDSRDIGAWEAVAWWLARNCGIDMAEAKVLRFGNGHHTFCVRRFDRAQGQRRFYASAMTLLKKQQSEGTSYLELAEFLVKHGDTQFLSADLEQLFRRVAFNVAIGNRDDHLRNHGFLLSDRGWRLSPAFDVNPSVDKTEHVLNIDDIDNRPSMELVESTASFYRLTTQLSRRIIGEVLSATRQWQITAKRAGISNIEIAETGSAFSAMTSGNQIYP